VGNSEVNKQEVMNCDDLQNSKPLNNLSRDEITNLKDLSAS